MFYTMGVPLCWKSYSILFWFYRPVGLPLKRCFNYLRAIPFQTLLLTCSKWQNYQTVATPLHSTSGPFISCVIDLSIPLGTHWPWWPSPKAWSDKLNRDQGKWLLKEEVSEWATLGLVLNGGWIALDSGMSIYECLWSLSKFRGKCRKCRAQNHLLT